MARQPRRARVSRRASTWRARLARFTASTIVIFVRSATMPFPIKTGLSIIVLLVALAGYFYQDSIGMHGRKVPILSLAPFMVVAMWIFPEVPRKYPQAEKRNANRKVAAFSAATF